MTIEIDHEIWVAIENDIAEERLVGKSNEEVVKESIKEEYGILRHLMDALLCSSSFMDYVKEHNVDLYNEANGDVYNDKFYDVSNNVMYTINTHELVNAATKRLNNAINTIND